jgi:hypothetical protein
MADLDDLDLLDLARAQHPGDELAQRQWVANYRRAQLDEVLGKGDDDGGGGFSMASAMPWLQVIAPIVKTGSDFAVQEIEKAQAHEQASRDKRAWLASHQDEQRAAATVANLRRGAAAADDDAAAAAAKAQYERDPNGPLHKAAARAAQLAQMMRTGTAGAAAKLEVYRPPAEAPPPPMRQPWWRASWVPYAGGGVAALAVIGAVYFATRRK